jgi:hypothetical protein
LAVLTWCGIDVSNDSKPKGCRLQSIHGARRCARKGLNGLAKARYNLVLIADVDATGGYKVESKE